MKDLEGNDLDVGDTVMVLDVRATIFDIRPVDGKSGEQELVAFCQTDAGLVAAYTEEIYLLAKVEA